MEIVIKTAAVTPPTIPLLSVKGQLLSQDVGNPIEVIVRISEGTTVNGFIMERVHAITYRLYMILFFTPT